jgi:hypothetical protein
MESELLKALAVDRERERDPEETAKIEEFVRWIKNYRARTLRLPMEYSSELDVLKAIAGNRAITTLDAGDDTCMVRMKTTM